MLTELKCMHTHKGVFMNVFKQAIANIFDKQKAKFGFNLNYVSGFLNHNEIKNFQKGICSINFENKQMTIKQNNEILVEEMKDVHSVRTWEYKRRYLIIEINTKTYNEYKFSIEIAGNVGNMIILKPLFTYLDAFGIPCEHSNDYDGEDIE